jgi:hypothetical protein
MTEEISSGTLPMTVSREVVQYFSIGLYQNFARAIKELISKAVFNTNPLLPCYLRLSFYLSMKRKTAPHKAVEASKETKSKHTMSPDFMISVSNNTLTLYRSKL